MSDDRMAYAATLIDRGDELEQRIMGFRAWITPGAKTGHLDEPDIAALREDIRTYVRDVNLSGVIYPQRVTDTLEALSGMLERAMDPSPPTEWFFINDDGESKSLPFNEALRRKCFRAATAMSGDGRYSIVWHFERLAPRRAR